MKTRFGYVSNSSSSSFCIAGVILDDSEFDDSVIDALKAEKKKDKKFSWCKEIDDMGARDFIYEFSDDFYPDGMSCHHGISDYSEDDLIFGFDMTMMKDDQTLGDVKDKVFGVLKRLGFTGEKEEITVMLDGGYLG